MIGNALNLKIIGENSSKVNLNWVETGNKIFKEYCKNIEEKYEKNYKIISEDGIFLCTISASNIFYLALITDNFPDKFIFQIIEDLKKENIHLLIDEKGELNKPGKQAFKAIIQHYDNTYYDLIADINGNINELKVDFQNNLKKVLGNTEDLQKLDVKANQLKSDANIFKKDARKLERKTCCQNFRWTILLIFVIIFLILIVALPLIIRNINGTSTGSNSISSEQGVVNSVKNNTRLLFNGNKK